MKKLLVVFTVVVVVTSAATGLTTASAKRVAHEVGPGPTHSIINTI